MAVRTLRPKRYTVIPTRVPWSGHFKYRVEAERPVDTFMLDEEELEKFRGGRSVNSFGGFDERRVHRGRGRLPFGGKWFLVISNPNEQPVAVYYDLPDTDLVSQ